MLGLAAEQDIRLVAVHQLVDDRDGYGVVRLSGLVPKLAYGALKLQLLSN